MEEICTKGNGFVTGGCYAIWKNIETGESGRIRKEEHVAVFKCDCGKNLSNSRCPNDIQMILFTDFEWEDIQEKVHEGADIYDAEPKYDVWRCPECLRVYVFKGVSLLYQYKLEK